MLYLRRFQLPAEAVEWRFLVENREIKRTCYGSRYPFGFFPPKKMPALTFAPITILCGGNGIGIVAAGLLWKKTQNLSGAIALAVAFTAAALAIVAVVVLVHKHQVKKKLEREEDEI